MTDEFQEDSDLLDWEEPSDELDCEGLLGRS